MTKLLPSTNRHAADRFLCQRPTTRKPYSTGAGHFRLKIKLLCVAAYVSSPTPLRQSYVLFGVSLFTDIFPSICIRLQSNLNHVQRWRIWSDAAAIRHSA